MCIIYISTENEVRIEYFLFGVCLSLGMLRKPIFGFWLLATVRFFVFNQFSVDILRSYPVIGERKLPIPQSFFEKWVFLTDRVWRSTKS